MLFTKKRSRLTLEAALRDAIHARRRAARLDAIERLGDASEAHAIEAAAQLQQLLQDNAGEIRQAAAVALGELCFVGAVKRLGAICQQDADPIARQGAVIALGKIGKLDDEAIAALEAACADAVADVRFQAVAAAAAALPPKKASAALRNLLEDEDAEVRGSAAAALGDLGDRSATNAVAALLADPDRATRIEAAVTLSRLGDLRGLEVLTKHLPDKDYGALVAEQLFHCADEQAHDALSAYAKRRFTDPVTGMWVAAALARLDDPGGRSLLLAGLTSSKPVVCGMAIELLGAMASAPWARKALVDMLENDDGGWREEIEGALEAKPEK